MRTFQLLILFLGLLAFNTEVYSQPLKFRQEKRIQTTSVKNQQRSGTCWSFATTSFVETELLRMGKGTYDLSEMFFVRNAYEAKANKFMRLHGLANFGEGGQAHDVLNIIRKIGFVPQEAYRGLEYGSDKHDHSELEAFMEGGLKNIIDKKPKSLTPAWENGINGILDAYLGTKPSSFIYEGKNYTPMSFAKQTGFNPDDYIELTSYTHHPYYRPFPLEVPDNWSGDSYYNLPLEELLKVMNYSIDNGFSVCWDGDVSEKDFDYRSGTATFTKSDSVDFVNIRQQSFNNWTSTDDHLMHIVGKAVDKNGKFFYYTKNSWGSDSNEYGGYLYLSDDYVKVKTIAILVNKKGIPAEIFKKIFE